MLELPVVSLEKIEPDDNSNPSIQLFECGESHATTEGDEHRSECCMGPMTLSLSESGVRLADPSKNGNSGTNTSFDRMNVLELIVTGSSISSRVKRSLPRKFRGIVVLAIVGRVSDACQNDRENEKEKQKNERNHMAPIRQRQT